MGRIIKALILGWIGKKIYDRVTDDGEETKPATAKTAPKASAHARKSAPKRTSGKTTRRAA